MHARLASLAAAAALSLSACAGAKPAPGCQLEFLFKAPDRPHERLEVYDEMVRTLPHGSAHEALRAPACALGADAVVITKSMVVNMFDHTQVQGYAIRWTTPAAPDPAPPAKPAPPPDPETLKL